MFVFAIPHIYTKTLWLNQWESQFNHKGFKMISALWTGIAGLAAQQTALDNESNNIANVNTVGYKASRV